MMRGLSGAAMARRQLGALCETVRVALGAAACSVARLDGDALVYEAAAGAGATRSSGSGCRCVRAWRVM